MLRWIWSISQYNLRTRDSRKRTPMGGPFMREHRASGSEKQQPKHNPCRPVGRNWKEPIIRHLLTVCLTKVHMIGIPTRSIENMRWYNPSQVLTAKHVLYPQLTTTYSASKYLLIPPNSSNFLLFPRNYSSMRTLYQSMDCLLSTLSFTWLSQRKSGGQGAIIKTCQIYNLCRCCGQLWVRHMICSQTCDELYHFPFYLIVLGYLQDSNRSSQPQPDTQVSRCL